MNKPTEYKNVIVCKEKLSPFWIAQWTDARGKRIRRSTKVPVGGGHFQGERLNAAQAQRRALMIAFQLAQAAEESYSAHDNTTMRQLCNTMLAGKLGRVSACTYDNARTDYTQFLRWLGKRADEPARFITRADLKAWIVERRAEVRHATVVKALGVIRSAFAYAVDAEIISTNPATGLKVPSDSRDEKIVHEAFTLEEVQLLIDKLPEEWSSAVRCCIGTYGQRLSDILNLQWSAFDWENRTVNLITGKTARELRQPMQDSFYAWAKERYLESKAKGGDSAIWVHPTLRHRSTPSYEFTTLVRLHGIGLIGKGLAGSRRTWHSKTFHSLRATVATMLQASGVSQGMAMELVGHDSAAVHAAYIRPNADQLRAAAAQLPQL